MTELVASGFWPDWREELARDVELGGKSAPVYTSWVDGMSELTLDFVQLMPVDCLVASKWNHYDSLMLATLFPFVILLVILAIGWTRRLRSGDEGSPRDDPSQDEQEFLVVRKKDLC